MRIHWSLGATYYGLEFAPAWVVLAGLPVPVAGVAVGLHRIGARLRAMGSSSPEMRVFTVTVEATLLVLLGIQAFLIVANL